MGRCIDDTSAHSVCCFSALPRAVYYLGVSLFVAYSNAHVVNSKCLRIIIKIGEISIQVEANVSEEVKTTIASTRLIAPQYSLPRRLVPIIDLSDALADKLAAWNERRLIRDIFDICFFLQMNVRPNAARLEKRLRKPSYSRLIKKKQYFIGANSAEFYDFLRLHAATLTDKTIKQELADYLLPDELIGLANYFRAALVKLK